MKPRYHTAGNLIQLRYSVPYDVQSSLIYPLSSSNGSSIVICGHSAGLFIIWRGGRPLKEPTASSATPDRPPASLKPQTSSDVMVIDLDDSESDSAKPTALATSSAAIDPPEAAAFDDEEPEPDPRQPYPPLVQTLNLPVAGGGVTHIAAPLLSNAVKRSLITPSLLGTCMVLALSCADAVVRLLILPLTPPSTQAKTRKGLAEHPQMGWAGKGSWGEILVEVPRGIGHTTLVNGIAVGISPRQLITDDIADGDDVVLRTKGAIPDNDANLESWDIMIASASADAGGTLLVHRIPVSSNGSKVEDNELQLWRKVFLKRPATGIDLHAGFATGVLSYPKILITEADGPVRIYECSNEETNEEGGWLGQLFAGHQGDEENKLSNRILSARFILGGYAVAALTSNGEWGVWDISKPSDAEFNEADFAYKTRLFTSPNSASKSLKATSALTKPPRPSSLAPMTPHTRKVRQQELFASDPNAGNKTKESNNSIFDPSVVRGGVALTLISRDLAGPAEDAHALLWYGNASVFVPNLRARHLSHLASSSSSSNLLSTLVSTKDPFASAPSSAPAQPRQIAPPDPGSLCGGSCVGAAILPSPSASRTSSVRTKIPEMVVVSERAFSIIGHPLAADGAAVRVKAKTRDVEMTDEGVAGLITSGIANAGGALTAGAELAIDGIESMLDSMAGSARHLSGRA